MKTFLRLLSFEIKKNFLSPWLLLFLLVMLLVNAWQLGQQYDRATNAVAGHEDLYEEFYSRWKGPITPEKVAEVMAIYGPLRQKCNTQTISYLPGSGTYLDTEYEDYRFFAKEFAEEMEYDYLYVNRAIDICANAKQLSAVHENNSCQAAKNEAIAKAFAGRKIPDFADTRYIEVWLHYDFSSLLVLLLCLLGLGTVFVTERETQMYMLQRTAKLGGGATVAAKLIAASGYMLLVCALFYTEDFAVLQYLSGHREALDSPVYAIPLLRTTRLNMTIGRFVLVFSAAKTLGILACGWMILLVSCLCRRVLGAYISSIGTMMALTLLQEVSLGQTWLKWFNPMEAVMVRELIWNASYVELFGRSIPLDVFVLAGIGLTLVLLFLAVLRCNPGCRARRRC